MVRHYALVMWGSVLRVKTSSIWTCDGNTLHCDLLGGVIFGAPSFLLVVVEVVWRCCEKHAWSMLLSCKVQW
jgi:hypothetical protein